MAPRIVLVGGGSTHWTPTLLVDFANTGALRDADVVLYDVAPDSVAPMVELGRHIARCRGIGLAVAGASSLQAALEGADYVVTAFSVGGFDSMRHDLQIPARYGIRQPVGDSVGPGGIFRALRSVPVVVEVATAMRAVCPDALLVNVSNPLSALCRAAALSAPVPVVGLCNELVGLQFTLSLLTDCPMHEVDPVVGGVNHLPLVTELRLGGDDGFAVLRDLTDGDGERAGEPLWMTPPEQMHWHKVSSGDGWTKGDVLHNNRLKLEVFRRSGVLPGSADTHVSEFFAGFVTEASDFGRDWGVHHYGLAGHMADKAADDAHLAELGQADEIPPWPSGELVATLLEGLVTGTERHLPVNLPNQGQVASLPEGVVVEAIGLTGPAGVRPRDVVSVPGWMGEHLRRVAASEEMTVEAALTGDPGLVLGAMLTDPMTSRLPHEQVVALRDELLVATAPWLPAFAR